jgi:hypothetical protein
MVHLHDDWKELLQLLTAAGVRFVLVGAHALAAHGRPRLTGDMDVFYEPTKANARRLKHALQGFGFPTAGLTLEALTNPDKLIMLGRVPCRVDLMTSIDGVSFREAWAGRVEVELAGERIAVLWLAELIANKRAAARPKDVADLALLDELLSDKVPASPPRVGRSRRAAKGSKSARRKVHR